MAVQNIEAYTRGNGSIDMNALIGDMVDRGIWTYYDTIEVAAGGTGATSIQAFSVPIGGTKTKLKTNMTRANQFPPPRCLVLDQIGFVFSSRMAKADIDLFLDSYYLEFKIDEKIFFEGPIWQFSAGYGLTGVTTKNNESAWTLGQPNFFATRRFGDFGKYIAPLQQFTFELIAPSAPTYSAAPNIGLYVQPFMGGLTDRAVQ